MRILLYIIGAILILLFAYLGYTAIFKGKEDQEVSVASIEREEESFHENSPKQQDTNEPLELSYDIDDEELLVSISGSSSPYTAILLDDRDSLIISVSDLREGQSKFLSGLGELPQGEYSIRVMDDSGQKQTSKLNINSLEDTTCLNDLSDEGKIIDQAKNLTVSWFKYVSYIRGAKSKKDSEKRERTIGYAKELFIDSLRQIEYISGALSQRRENDILHEYLRGLGINQKYPLVEIDISDFHLIEDWEYDQETQTLVAKAKFISNYRGFREEAVKRDIVTYQQILVYSEENTKTVELRMRKVDCPDERTNKLVYKGCCVILLGDFKTLS